MVKFSVDDRIIMIKGDAWASPGQTGTVERVDNSHIAEQVIVRWDVDGKNFWHTASRLALLSDNKDPNVAFLLRKK